MPPVFDTYQSVRRLMEAGVPENQAVAHVREQAQLLADTVATKEDLRAIDHRYNGLELALKALEQRIGGELAMLRAEARASEARIRKYMIALAGAAVALNKVL